MSPQAGWLLQEQVVPRLRTIIPQAVRCVGCEDAEELIQDATAMAAGILHNAEAAGKKVAASSVAYYAIQHCKSGRRSVGNSRVDVLAASTQLNGHTRMTSLDEVAAANEECGGDIFTFNDVLSNDQEDPSTKAARKMDWEAFCAGLPERERVAVVLVAEGKSLREAARLLGVSDSTMQSSKRRLGVKILEFMGADILVEVRRRPQWRNSLEATRERQACRVQRQAA
jgi:DNA-directed RNA polymerase specialized sigma24 family protein